MATERVEGTAVREAARGEAREERVREAARGEARGEQVREAARGEAREERTEWGATSGGEEGGEGRRACGRREAREGIWALGFPQPANPYAVVCRNRGVAAPEAGCCVVTPLCCESLEPSRELAG